MSRVHKKRETVWAILRWDGFHPADSEPEVMLTVKEVVRSAEIADAEITRLNSLAEDGDVHYWTQPTRLFPEGTSAGSDEPDVV